MAVTLKDISRVCGINICSVSQALSGNPRALELSESTRHRICDVARQLGYCRNELARSVVTGKSRIVSVIVNNFALFPPILDGICAAAVEHNLTIKFVSLSQDQDLSRSLQSVKQYRSIGLLGVAFGSDLLFALQQQFLSSQIPCVITNIGITGSGVTTISTDQSAATCLALDYLYGLGHRDIVFLGDIAPRRESYLAFMSRFALLPRVLPVVDEVSFTSLLASVPDAVFCCSDTYGVSLLQWLYRRRRFVPECFSVMGFGGTTASESCSPPLSTVQEPFFEIGYQMLVSLSDLINGRCGHQHQQLPAQLLIRESTTLRRQ